ncbi:MAG: response regulator SirA [Chlorobi bacterium]|nr:response regulator SirA [Chlorobiota bacterium]
MGKIKEVIKRNGAVVPFNPLRISNAIYRAAVAVGGRDKKTAEALADKVVEALEQMEFENGNPHIEEIQDVVEKVLIENGHATVAKEYILYREEANRRRATDQKYSTKEDNNIPWAKLWHVLNWAVKNDLHTIESLNKKIKNGEFAEVVHISEKAYEHNIDTAAKLISERHDALKMVMVSGPSSSGKTTTTIRLEEKLKGEGFKFVPLVVDNYYFDLELHPKDEFGDYDFETPQALDLELINEHLLALSEGKEVKIPYYDFKAGKRTLNATPMQLKEGEILLIDSLFGLYPKFSEAIADNIKFKLYLEPLLQMKTSEGRYIRWTDIRLIRRMLRDSVQRAYNPQQTLEHWHYVRSSEMRNLIPYNSTADYIINTNMPYEIALYRPLLLDSFLKWREEFKGNPLKEDAYERAERCASFLSEVEGVEDDSPVPKNSVLREFIGGSIYEY